MFLEDQWKIFVKRNRHLQLVVADALPLQLGLLSRNYAGGLVEQLPYEMGELSMTALLELVEGRPYPKFKGTNVLEHINVPLVLPHLSVNQNHLGGLKYVGFVFAGMIVIVATFCICWTFQKRNVRVVKVSQPFFLIMVASGVLIMGLSIIPLSFDDSVFNHTDERGVVVCMSPLWLLFCGFTVTFSAFFAKTWRINKLFHSQTPYQRATVNAKDVLFPFFILMTLNIICLSLWTSIDPLKLARHEHDGTDGWNRIISTYSICECNNSLPYVLPLAVINFGVLVLANYEAFKARMIESEFSESKYIAIAMVSITQASLSGIPLLFLVREQPEAFYLVVVLLFSITCMVILLVIFIPKMKMSKRFLERSADSQRNVIRESILVSRKAAEASSQHRSSMSRKQSSMGPPDGKPQTPHSRAEGSTCQESSFNQSISVPKSTKRGSFGSSQFSSGSMISRQFDQLDDTSASFNMDKSIGSAFAKRLSDLRENDSEYEDSKASGCLDTSVGSAKLADTKQEEQPVTSSSN
mmetsp:Transcript_3441/g.5037  ORF Transcript_3441/g.5037 Transcript_3441/m.5037 type:complete len:525 (-) Transcript_3441:479-2053(-)